MKTEAVDGSLERRVLLGMIFCDPFLARVASKWKGEMFPSRVSNLLGQWCVDHHEAYSSAPGRGLRSILEAKAEGLDEETLGLAESFLEALPEKGEEEEINLPLLTDLAGAFFRDVRLKKLADAILDDVKAGRGKFAEEKVSSHHSLELGGSGYIDPFLDAAPIQAAFQAQLEPLVFLGEPLDSFFANSLGRDCFIALLAPEKGAKSMYLMEIGYRAMCQRRKVAYFVIGDMSEGQVLLRLMSRCTRRPIFADENKWPTRVRIPTSIKSMRNKQEQDEGEEKWALPKVEWEVKEHKGPLTESEALEGCKKVMSRKVKSKKSYFRMVVHPGGCVTAKQIHQTLKEWANEGYCTDVAIVDYSDNLQHESPKMDLRDRICETWLQLRRLSQEMHCLLVTATQCNREGYSARCLSRQHVSDDKRKLAHLTAGFGIMSTGPEKDLQVARLNCFARREGNFNHRRCMYVAQCLATCEPAVLACWE